MKKILVLAAAAMLAPLAACGSDHDSVTNTSMSATDANGNTTVSNTTTTTDR